MQNKISCTIKFLNSNILNINYNVLYSGHMVELFTDDRVKQRFHETVCDPDFFDKPCRFLQGQNQRRSMCSQQHTYTYALVRRNDSLTGWSLDHIRIRNGCVCQVTPHAKKKKHKLEPDLDTSFRESRGRARTLRM
jgi:hypothetical protein